jgi:hypothetical protein
LSPSGHGQGISCYANGAFIDSIPLLKRTHDNAWIAREAAELSEALGAHFGLPFDISSKSAGLDAIARALNAGDIAHAQLVTLHQQIPETPQLAKSASPHEDAIAFIVNLHRGGLLKGNFDPAKHPRWPAGTPPRQGGRFAPKDAGIGEPGIGHNQGPPLESDEIGYDAQLPVEAEDGAALYGLEAAAVLAVPFLLASTTSPNTGEDEYVATQHWHHSWPKYLGGLQDQILTRLPEELHVEYHRRPDKVAPRRFGQQYFDDLDPQRRRDLVREVADVTRKFDAEYGTHLYEQMIKNGFPEIP